MQASLAAVANASRTPQHLICDTTGVILLISGYAFQTVRLV